jgi:hypothetical protein
MNTEDQIVEQAATNMAQDIDREILWSMLTQLGWVRVILPSNLADNVDIAQWLALNCSKAVEHYRSDFLFENEKDANWFKLRWL